MYILLLFLVMIGSLTRVFPTIDALLKKYDKILKRCILSLAFLSTVFVFFPEMQKETGELALDLLWFILWLPVLAKVFNQSLAKKLMLYRKELGILMGMLGLVHATWFFVMAGFSSIGQEWFWLANGNPTFMAFGFCALVISTVLLVTSNVKSMRLLWKNWKLLHRFVYLLVILTVFHVIAIKWSKSGHIDYLELIPLIAYFAAKVVEWKWIQILKSAPAVQK